MLPLLTKISLAMTKQELVRASLETLRQRVADFLQDGYKVIVASSTPNYAVYKLRHRSNENVIVIVAKPFDNFMIQKMNGDIIYSGKIHRS